MSSVGLAKNTVYKQYVFDRVGQCTSAMSAAYTYDELAVMVGLKPTHNFRRRIREMAQAGLLGTITAFTPRGGLTILFHHPSFQPMGKTE